MPSSTSPAASAGAAAWTARPTCSAAPPEQQRVADRFGCCDKQQLLGVGRENSQTLEKRFLDPGGERRGGGDSEATGQLAHAQAGRQLQERQRITSGLVDDPIDYLLIWSMRELER